MRLRITPARARWWLSIGLAVAMSAISSDGPALQAQERTVQQQNESILNELRAIRQLLERLSAPPPQPQNAKLANLGGMILGQADAPLTMVEYSDLQCPFCREYAATAFDRIKKNWIDRGKLRYLARDVPLDAMHPHARIAARAARCSGEKGNFWGMRTTLMRNGNLLSADFISRTAAALKLDASIFGRCLQEKTFDAEIAADMNEAAAIGVRGTPTFVLGRTMGNTLEGVIIVGAQPYEAFDAKLKALLTAGTK
jgi:protein-disulfide isomerase